MHNQHRKLATCTHKARETGVAIPVPHSRSAIAPLRSKAPWEGLLLPSSAPLIVRDCPTANNGAISMPVPSQISQVHISTGAIVAVTHRPRHMAHLHRLVASPRSPWQARLVSGFTPCFPFPARDGVSLGVGSRRGGGLRLLVTTRGRRGVTMAVAGMAGEAVKGAVREAWSVTGVTPVGRVLIFLTLMAIILRELAGTVSLASYGAYALWLYSSLRAWRNDEELGAMGTSSATGVMIARNVRYGHSQRNLLDVYVPERKGAKPVVVFVHGGVWSSGDKWQFSPLGSFLAEEGVVAVLVQYTLYPKILAIDQVSEVSDALTWTMDNIAEYGGDPSRVFLMGHSSGAHLSAMALWERASRRVENAQRLLPETVDVRIPAGFLGLAGVYNIGEHFKYELQRGVAAVSCMRPVMGWEQGFDSMSPSLLFESLLTLPGVSFLPAGETDPAAQTQVRGADLMPRCLFIVSHNDITVPPDSSFAFNSMLLALGCESRVVINDSLAHGDFVLWHEGWGNLRAHMGSYLEKILNFVRVDKSDYR